MDAEHQREDNAERIVMATAADDDEEEVRRACKRNGVYAAHSVCGWFLTHQVELFSAESLTTASSTSSLQGAFRCVDACSNGDLVYAIRKASGGLCEYGRSC